MVHSPVTPPAFEAILDELGADRSPLARIRTAAHAACARRRRAASSRHDADAVLAAILGAAEDPFPALKHHR